MGNRGGVHQCYVNEHVAQSGKVCYTFKLVIRRLCRGKEIGFVRYGYCETTFGSRGALWASDQPLAPSYEEVHLHQTQWHSYY